MALTLATTMRDAISDAVDALIGTTATLELQDSGNTEIATITLGNPAFGASSSGVITMAGAPLSDTNATGGVMAKFQIKSGGSTVQISGSVGTSGEDINFAGGLVVGAADTVTLTSFTITCPAS